MEMQTLREMNAASYCPRPSPVAFRLRKAGNYPSLNPRPIEAKAAGLLTEPAPQAANVQPATADVSAKINAAMSAAQRGDAAFNAALAGARSAVRGAGASGSESWIAAQMAVSQLETSRAPVKASLSDLDSLLRAALAGPPSEDLPNVEAAIRTMEGIDARHTEAMAELLKALSR